MKRNGITKDVLWLNILWMPNDFILKDCMKFRWKNVGVKILSICKILIFYYKFLLFLAHYRPVEPNKQSFIYNAAGKWI